MVEKTTTATKLREEDLVKEEEKFSQIIYSNLEMILEKRPTYPVTKFAKA